jgi:glyoxylase-like metal-dependent hydrolase (beta-lactamase superfamily II)
MNALTLETHAVALDTSALTTFFPVPGLGILPVHAFVVRAAHPVLIDTGLAMQREAFLEQLRAILDPRELRWIWITHTDADHVGNLEAVLGEAPNATVVTTFVGMAKMGLLELQVPRTHLLNPGQRLDAGDRKLLAVAPPTFDAPETTGLLDERTGALFSADSLGALLDAPALDAADVDPGKLAHGMVTWATVDAPWLRWVDPARFGESLDAVHRLDPSVILSSHLPPARNLTRTLLDTVASAREAPRFVGPDQAALENLMARA